MVLLISIPHINLSYHGNRFLGAVPSGLRLLVAKCICEQTGLNKHLGVEQTEALDNQWGLSFSVTDKLSISDESSMRIDDNIPSHKMLDVKPNPKNPRQYSVLWCIHEELLIALISRATFTNII